MDGHGPRGELKEVRNQRREMKSKGRDGGSERRRTWIGRRQNGSGPEEEKRELVEGCEGPNEGNGIPGSQTDYRTQFTVNISFLIPRQPHRFVMSM